MTDGDILEYLVKASDTAQANAVKIASLDEAVRNGLTHRMNRIDKRVWWILTVAILGLAITAAEVAAAWSGG